MIILKCSCQIGFHALDYGEKEEKYLSDLINKKGQYKKIIDAETQKAYKVPIAFILVHGIEQSKLETYGFDQWQDPPAI